MKSIPSLYIILLICLFALFLAGCEGYDRGYEAGYESMKKGISYKFSSSYRAGYHDGWHDADMFNKGYYDAQHGYAPESDDPSYMEGYRSTQ